VIPPGARGRSAGWSCRGASSADRPDGCAPSGALCELRRHPDSHPPQPSRTQRARPLPRRAALGRLLPTGPFPHATAPAPLPSPPPPRSTMHIIERGAERFGHRGVLLILVGIMWVGIGIGIEF